MQIDLSRPDYAYLFGFLQTDGHLSGGPGNKGRISLELKADDVAVLRRLQDILPVYTSLGLRERNTNFKRGYKSVVLRMYDMGTRQALEALGLPRGKKSDLIEPPTGNFSEVDYIRGIIDGDGSLGFTGAGFPFLSLATKSHSLAVAMLDFIHRTTAKRKTVRPNARDKMYNITLYKEDAQAVAKLLYANACIALDRKSKLALRILKWKRPTGMRKVTWARRRWTRAEDALVRTMSVTVAAQHLGRTERSVRVRASRLRKGLGGVQEGDVSQVRRNQGQ